MYMRCAAAHLQTQQCHAHTTADDFSVTSRGFEPLPPALSSCTVSRICASSRASSSCFSSLHRCLDINPGRVQMARVPFTSSAGPALAIMMQVSSARYEGRHTCNEASQLGSDASPHLKRLSSNFAPLYARTVLPSRTPACSAAPFGATNVTTPLSTPSADRSTANPKLSSCKHRMSKIQLVAMSTYARLLLAHLRQLGCCPSKVADRGLCRQATRMQGRGPVSSCGMQWATRDHTPGLSALH